MPQVKALTRGSMPVDDDFRSYRSVQRVVEKKKKDKLGATPPSPPQEEWVSTCIKWVLSQKAGYSSLSSVVERPT